MLWSVARTVRKGERETVRRPEERDCMIERGFAIEPPLPQSGTVMVVDDDSLAQAYARRLLVSKGYQVATALSGEEALQRLRANETTPDVIVLDVHMTGMSGLEALREIKADKRLSLIPVLVVTGDKEYKIEALKLGASDFISKPFHAAEMRARVVTQVRMSQAIQALENAEDVLVTLANTIEARDSYTESHTRHVSSLAEEVGRMLGLEYESDIRILRLGGYLHDIGKIAISDAILIKSSELSDEEWVTMRSHPVIGYNLLKPLKTLRDILPAILHHHERWDGSGYPRGLKGPSIPLSARVIGIVDCFDAVTTDRPYRKAMTREQAVELLKEDCRAGWDPEVLEALLEIIRDPAAYAAKAS